MRNLDKKVTRSDNQITWTARNGILHVNKTMHNNPYLMTTMVKWAYENPFRKIGGEVVQHNPDYTEVEMTETDTEEFRSPASTVTQYQFQRLTPLRQGTPRKPLQSDTVMIDAPSVYDEQLAMMIKQVQGASMYLYKLSNEDRKIATDQYTHLMNITEQLHKEFSETTNKDRNSSARV